MKYSNIFDSHAHYDDEAFDTDRDELLASLPEKGVCHVVDCGADLPSSRAAIALAAKYGYFSAAAGIHPEEAKNAPDGWEKALEALLSDPHIVAVGEIGLDYHFEENAPREVQKELFERQILLAKRHGLPVIVHDRDAHGDTMELLRRHRPQGVIHCFSGSAEMAAEAVRLGMYIGVGGSVTFKNARVPVEVVKSLPPDRLLLETDCPYLAPVPFRGRRNDSSLIACVAEKVAEIRGGNPQDILNLAKKNAEDLFRVKA
ncbi:TatD family deoxyribonuclease [Caproiciproducens sp. NJN-50]|uniref:TatD family hydrolase n=1 Tax=Acutalibacteraceae TaxID=3082771 RepID=UPI000FFE166A|nr:MULTISPECIES: TatD family hydrolase [Acutalibacteraceae]QAT48799.1 TatD family deoxyribonuclease [Caproiciproducens sp. NJN-50]